MLMAEVARSDAAEFYGNGNPKTDADGNRLCPHGAGADPERFRSSTCNDCQIAEETRKKWQREHGDPRERRRRTADAKARARAEGTVYIAENVTHGSVSSARFGCECEPCAKLRTYIKRFRRKGLTASMAAAEWRRAEAALALAQREYQRTRTETAARMVANRLAELRALDFLMRQAPGASGSMHSGRGSVRNPIKGKVL